MRPGGNSMPISFTRKLPGHGVEHLVGRIALAEQDVAFLVFARAHERAQPVHRQIALRGRPRLLHQREHLAQPDHVDRQREQIQKEGRNRAGERAVADEEHDADDADDAQRHDGAHHQRRDVEDGADQRQHVGECDIGEDDVDQPVEHRVIGDVGRIEADLDQELFDPQILRRVFERAIEYCSQIEVGAAHTSLITVCRRRPDPGRPRIGIAAQAVRARQQFTCCGLGANLFRHRRRGECQ